MAGCAAGLLDPRRRVHGITEKGYLSLESADLSGNDIQALLRLLAKAKISARRAIGSDRGKSR